MNKISSATNISLNRITLPEKWKKHCGNLPESGMGYQKVNCKVSKEGKEAIVSGIILNGEFFEAIEQINPENILDISMS